MAKHRAPRRRGPLRVLTGVAVASVLVGGAAVVAVAMGQSERPELAPVAQPAVVEPTRSPEPVTVVREAAVVRQDPAPPAGSGKGRRIVFSQSQQRVWLIGARDDVERTYLVSGSKHDNLKPGNYHVQAKYRHATAYDASGSMEYFVRFATGFSEPIGFHTVPRDNQGKLEQTKSQLGQRLSAGCVRQWKDDAIALWEFAPVGTPVVVTP